MCTHTYHIYVYCKAKLKCSKSVWVSSWVCVNTQMSERERESVCVCVRVIVLVYVWERGVSVSITCYKVINLEKTDLPLYKGEAKLNKNFKKKNIYSSNSCHEQDVSQGQFLSRVELIWIPTFPSPRLVTISKIKSPVCLTIYP